MFTMHELIPSSRARLGGTMDRVEVVQSKLLEMLQQLEDEHEKRCRLEAENRLLAEEIAKQKARLLELETAVTPDAEQLTWEERKQLILRQLEREDLDEAQRTEWIDVVAEAERVIADRDRQIVELRDLLRCRSQASVLPENQVAMGAAGIAAMLDSNEIIQDERESLQALQDEWISKIADAEAETTLENVRRRLRPS